MAGLVLSVFVSGCERTVSKEETTKVNSDGSVKTTEKTVKQGSDGSVTKTETKDVNRNP